MRIRFWLWLAAAAFLPLNPALAVSLREYTGGRPIPLFVVVKGAKMPNDTDQVNTLKEGDVALLMSSKELTDLEGISELQVEVGGKTMPIQQAKNLHLYFNHNRISRIPGEIGRMKNVLYLNFEHNQISDLPAELKDMGSLNGLFFGSNQFDRLPEVVFQMTELRKMNFSRNRITDLTDRIGNLAELRSFNMPNNLITRMPASMSKMIHLHVCDLSDNQIAEIPESFGNVKIVNQFRIRNNPITALPAGFAAMPGTIDITGTKIDKEKLSPELKARLDTEKPPGAKDWDKKAILPNNIEEKKMKNKKDKKDQKNQ